MTPLRSGVAFLLLLGATLLVGSQLVKRSFERSLDHSIESGFKEASDIVVARVAEMFTVPLGDSVPLTDPGKIVNTYMHAILVGQAADSLARHGELPESSAGLSGLSPENRLDGWGYPFCLRPVDRGIALISMGPFQGPDARCRALPMDPATLDTLPPATLYRYASGVLVFVTDPP